MDSAKGTAKQLRDLSKIYMEAVYGGKKKEEKKDTRMVVTAADKKANTPAYQKYKAGSKLYKAADHMKEDKKYGYDKDGNSLNPADIEERKKKDDDLAGSPNKKGKKAKRWWDDDGDGKGYEDGEVDGKFPDKDGSKKKKVKEEVEVDESVPTNEETILEKDTPKQVAAVIDMYRSKKGTGEAVKDTEEGKKAAAKKERDYAAWERSKMRRDDPDWKHKKGSTTESVEADKYIETIKKVKEEELEADIKRWSALEESGKFTKEEIESIKEADRLGKYEDYDELDDELLQIVEDNLGVKTEDEIIELMESGWHRRNPGKKHPLESGSSKVTPRPVSDAEKKSTDKSDRMYVAMRRVKDRQKNYSKEKSDAADRLHGHYTDRQSRRKKGASPKEAASQSHGDFGSKGFNVKRGGRKGLAPRTDRGTGNKAARRAGQEVKNRDPRK